MTTDRERDTDGVEAPHQGVLLLNRRTYLKAGTAASLPLFGGNAAARCGTADSTAGDVVAPESLRVDYEQTPNNLDPTGDPPRFFWELPISQRGASQSAYHILVADSEAALQNENGNI